MNTTVNESSNVNQFYTSGYATWVQSASLIMTSLMTS